MKIFVFSDPHADRRLLGEVFGEMERNEYDVFLGLGDFMDRRYFSSLVTGLKVEKKAFIPGNRDYNLKKLPYLRDLDSFDFGGIRFVLIGSHHSSALKESILKRCEGIGGDELVFCSHEPPYRTRDEIRSGARVGVPEFREIIEEKKPLAWLCGHIHEAEGVSTVEGTKVVNVSASKEVLGYRMVLDNGELSKVERVGR